MPQTPIRRLAVVVSDREAVSAAAGRALTDLAAGGRAVDVDVPAAADPANAEYREIVRRGLRFLDQAVPADPFTLLTVDSLAAVPEAVGRAARGERSVLTLLILDHTEHRYRTTSPDELNEGLAKLTQALGERVEFEPGPYTVQVYTEPDIASYYSIEHFTPRWTPDEPWVAAADLACAFVDSVQLHCNARLRHPLKPSVVADAIADFLTAQAGSAWGLGYYTGSGVATFIDDIERRAVENGSPIVRGPSEHSLACSALARWRLDEAPFAIVVTTGMHEEFRGTLANHVAVGTRGIIVCCDSRTDQWHPFQGTIHAAGDSRPSLLAKGFPVVYIGKPDEIARGMAEVFEAYSSGRGPVMLLATREVLQASSAPGELPKAVAEQPARAEAVRSPAVERLAELLNTSPRRILCQVGPLGPEARELMYSLARRAGIGLVDSVAQPGTVSRYHDGEVVDEYLGTLSMYGYSARVYEYLFTDGMPRPVEEQAVMFVGTQIPEIDRPFTESALRQLKPIQITDREADRAPFTDLGIVGDLEGVLRGLHELLDVEPGVLALRRAAIGASPDTDGDVIGSLPILPMTLNYFFRRLRGVLDGLIQQQDYRYTGVYDIGRAGLTAVNALPRTGTGVSGWYGRGLMGDGLMSLPGVATRRDQNVISFTGDGTAGMVPDILPALVQQIGADRSAFPHNLSIFRFVNGSLSVIRTYRENIQPAVVTGQTGVLSLTPDDYERRIGSLTVRHRRIVRFEDAPLAEQLTEGGTINLYSVITGHNNEGDGLGRLAALGWQRNELSPRAVALTGGSQQRG
ncbi:MAG TPA: hypothetical protein VGM10_25755 [Actinocrinis sp.]|jgi:thiamine pyrophosphate-dependent acetolactate synthase large subunit-like protein